MRIGWLKNWTTSELDIFSFKQIIRSQTPKQTWSWNSYRDSTFSISGYNEYVSLIHECQGIYFAQSIVELIILAELDLPWKQDDIITDPLIYIFCIIVNYTVSGMVSIADFITELSTTPSSLFIFQLLTEKRRWVYVECTILWVPRTNQSRKIKADKKDLNHKMDMWTCTLFQRVCSSMSAHLHPSWKIQSYHWVLLSLTLIKEKN